MTSTPRNRQLNIIDGALLSAKIVKDASEAAPVLGPFKATAGLVITILETIRDVKTNKKDWITLGEHLSIQIKDIHDDLSRCSTPHSTELLLVVNTYEQKLEDVLAKIRLTRGRGRFERYLNSRTDKEEIATLRRDVDTCWKDFMRKITLQVLEAAHRIEERVKSVGEDMTNVGKDLKSVGKDVKNVEKGVQKVETSVDAIGDTSYFTKLVPLPSATGADHNTCLAGTRTGVLDYIRQWADQHNTTQVCWLTDVAGAGKSTIAKQLSGEWKIEGRLGGCFFFNKNRPDTTNKQAFCDTIAAQLANNQPQLLPSIIDGIKAIGPILSVCPFEEKLQKLVIQPLQDTALILVIDALDECDERDRNIILRNLLRSLTQATRLKLLITSRPERDITELLDSYRSPTDSLHDVGLKSNQHDIGIFVKDEMKHLVRTGKLTAEEVTQLANRVNCLFILASTACKVIQKSLRPRSKLQDLMDSKRNSLGDINKLYLAILTKACQADQNGQSTDSKAPKEVIEVLQAILAAATPLSISTIDLLLGSESTERVVEFLSSVLNVRHDGTVVILHPTFREFLEDGNEAGTFHIDIGDAHGLMAKGCLATMKQELRFNICRLESSFFRNRDVPDFNERVSKYIPEQLQYGCTHWLDHVTKSGRKFCEDSGTAALEFVEAGSPLYWMEVLSALGKIPKILRDLQEVGNWYSEKKLKDKFKDIKRFLVAFSTPVSESIPHIYISTIPFAARKSYIGQEARGLFPKTISVMTGYPENWPEPPQQWQGHTSNVYSVAFSPDGCYIVSSSFDETIRLWDAETGQQLGEPLRGHTDIVWSVSFSPDGRRIVSGSLDKTIRLWDTETGQQLGEPLRGHTDSIYSVSLSPDGRRIVSGSLDKTIRLWDAETGQPSGEPFRGHTDSVHSVSFSPDGRRIVSGSLDKTIRLWDAETGQPLGEPLRGHTESVLSVLFSPDGRRIVSGSLDKTIRLWDAETGQPLGEPLRGHTRSVYSVIFSSDGRRIVSGSDDKTIRLWDADTGQPLGEPLRGHTETVCSISFSPNGRYIVSSSFDKTIRLWDAETGQPSGEPLRGHTSYVYSVSFSPDGRRIVSGSVDNTIQVWDAETGQPLGEPLRGHTGSVYSVSFSPDGRYIVSSSFDKTIRLWDAETVQPFGEPLRGHAGYVASVSFSPDSRRVVSGSNDNTFQLWSAVVCHTLEEQSHPNTHMVSTTTLNNAPDKVPLPQSNEPHNSIHFLHFHPGPHFAPPGFNDCELSQDGWVSSSNRLLYWVPPSNRNGLRSSHILTIPTNSPLRPTWIDFTNFCCGTDWIKCRK
ncbi:hypothetical protein FRC16_001995 [Serendipita sp. 398]|nr:hypothetical protein FRC16_001995 [Serendipita sp. 398]